MTVIDLFTARYIKDYVPTLHNDNIRKKNSVPSRPTQSCHSCVHL
jgi:hypothetical protein